MKRCLLAKIYTAETVNHSLRDDGRIYDSGGWTRKVVNPRLSRPTNRIWKCGNTLLGNEFNKISAAKMGIWKFENAILRLCFLFYITSNLSSWKWQLSRENMGARPACVCENFELRLRWTVRLRGWIPRWCRWGWIAATKSATNLWLSPLTRQ
jgi:hypothetical protein